MPDLLGEADRRTLAREAALADGSFLAGVRHSLRFDVEKFAALCRALHAASRVAAGSDTLPRELSQLVWYCGTFVPRWLGQRDFAVGQPDVDYAAVERVLRTLGSEWFTDNPIPEAELDQLLAAVRQR